MQPDKEPNAGTSETTEQSSPKRPGKRMWIREPFSGLSHLTGAVLSALGLIVLLVLARGRPWHTLGFTIYGLSLIVLYTSSALYHSLPASERRMERLMRLDYSAIFLLIAGTYAPLCLVPLRSGWGLPLLGAEYALAVIGIGCVLLRGSKPEWLRVILYLGMGWLAVLAIPALRAVLPPSALAWLIGGGVIYTVGTVFYATNRPRLWPGRFGSHDLWHVFVMAGSACHFLVMLSVAAFA